MRQHSSASLFARTNEKKCMLILFLQVYHLYFQFSPSFHRFNSKVSYSHLKLLRTLVTRLSRILHAKILYTPQIIAHQFFVCDMTTKFILYYYYIYYYYYYIIHNTLSLCFLLNIETDRLGLVSSYLKTDAEKRRLNTVVFYYCV